VGIVVTDLAVFRGLDGTLVLEDVAPGFTADEVLELADLGVVGMEAGA
jgi:acyl CoA:acetate/3-ketoacid CoA transferase beta subunit